MFVLALKKSRLVTADKIVAETTKRVTKQQRELLQFVKVALGVAHSTTPKIFACDEAETSKRHPLTHCIPWMGNETYTYPGSLIASNEELMNQVSIIERGLRAVDRISSNVREPGQHTEDTNFYMSQLIVIREARNNIIAWHGDHELGSHALARTHLVFGLS
jgi:hypothetical protein